MCWSLQPHVPEAATLRVAGRRGSVNEEQIKSDADTASGVGPKGRYTRRRSSTASESIQEAAASKLNIK